MSGSAVPYIHEIAGHSDCQSNTSALMNRYCLTALLLLATQLNGAASADSLSTVSAAALARCSSSCAPPKRCSLVAERVTCQDSCYANRCSRNENCAQRQCDRATQRPCDPRVFCFAAVTTSASVTSPLVTVVSDSAGLPSVLFGSTLPIDEVTPSTQAPAWSQLTAAIVQTIPPASQTPAALDKSQPSAERRCGLDNNSNNITCDELQVCVQDGRTNSRVCMDLCIPQRCRTSQVCRMRTLALCAGERSCRKVATCK